METGQVVLEEARDSLGLTGRSRMGLQDGPIRESMARAKQRVNITSSEPEIALDSSESDGLDSF